MLIKFLRAGRTITGRAVVTCGYFAFLLSMLLPSMQCAADPLAAVRYDWRNAVIGGGGFTPGIVFSRAERGLVYLRTDIGGAYRWDQKLQRWIPLQDDMAESQYFGIESIAADPVDPEVVYAAAGMYGREAAHAVLRSRDRGRSWEVFPVSFRMGGNEPGRGVGERLAIDPRNRSVLYFGSRHDGLQRSRDAGATWQQVRSFPVSGGGSTGLSFVVTAASPTIIVGVADPGAHHLYRSDDAGANWHVIGGEPEASLLPLQAQLDARGALYVTYGSGAGPNGVTAGAVYRYELGSGRWTDITPDRALAHAKRGFMGLSLDAQHPGVLLVASLNNMAGDTLWRSLDGGAHWQSLRERSHMDVSATPFLKWDRPEADFGWWMAGVAIDPFDGNHVVFSTGATLYENRVLSDADAGRALEWRPWVTGMEETAVLALTSPPAGPQLLSGFGDIGGFAHFDFNRSPAGMYTHPAWDNTFTIDFAALDPRVVVRSGRRHSDPQPDTRTLAWSADYAQHWEPLQLPAAQRTPAYLRGEVPIIITADGGTFIAMSPTPLLTRDHGQSWQAVRGLPEGSHVIADRVDAKRLYALDFAQGTIYTSVDGGTSFNALPTRGLSGNIANGQGMRVDTPWPLLATPGIGGDLWLVDQGSLWHSSDGGKNFTRVDNRQGVSVAVLGFGKAAPGRRYPALYAIGRAGRLLAIWRSDDAGRNWLRLNDARHEYGRRFRVISGDPRRYGRVYVGTDGRGILYGDPQPAHGATSAD